MAKERNRSPFGEAKADKLSIMIPALIQGRINEIEKKLSSQSGLEVHTLDHQECQERIEQSYSSFSIEKRENEQMVQEYEDLQYCMSVLKKPITIYRIDCNCKEKILIFIPHISNPRTLNHKGLDVLICTTKAPIYREVAQKEVGQKTSTGAILLEKIRFN